MKQTCIVTLLVFVSLTANAQEIKGDLNSNNKIDVADITLLIDTYLKKASCPDSNTYIVNGVSFKMKPIAGGKFRMGAQKTNSDGANYDEEANDDEAPVHIVTLSDFCIGETEVTQELWEAVIGNNPSVFKGEKLPVEHVSWNDCMEFITKLNLLTNQNFRLPTEAEWEYAARGGSKSQGYKYSGSNTIDDIAWYNDNSKVSTHEVASKLPNELGLYDMSGNVYELCQDAPIIYTRYSVTNPLAPVKSDSYCAIRGGSWYCADKDCRVSKRFHSTPTNADDWIGFRLAR